MGDLAELDQEQDEQDGGESANYETTDGKPYADDFSNLAENRIAQLRDICNAMDERDQWARMIELIRCTLRRYFLIGQQHPYWNADAGQFQVGPSGITLGDEDENAEEFFEEEFNLYQAYHDVFVSVFSQTAAPTRVEPSNLSGRSVRAAKEAEKYVTVYEHFNPPKCSQRDVATLIWTDGRILAVTDYEEDEEKCGTDDRGETLGTEFTCYYGVLESKVPIVEPFKLWPYARVDRDIDTLTAQDENPRIASKIKEGGRGQIANNEIARMSRIAVAEGIAQVSSDTLAYLVTESTYWLRPAAFRHLDKDEMAFWIGGKTKGEDGEVQENEGLCPKGFRVKWVGTVFAEGNKDKTLDRQCKVMHARPGTGNARGSKSDPLVPVQMEFNDAMGMYSEMIHKCIPRTWLNVQQESLAAIVEQFSRYGEYSALDTPVTGPMADAFFQETPVDVPSSFGVWMQNLQATLPQMLANIQPAMFGGIMEDQKTAKAYQQAKDMSLGVMAIVWVPYLEFKAGVCWQAARLSAQREQTQMVVSIPQQNGKSKRISLDTSVLGEGGFLCKPVTDQNFPESHTDISNKWIALLQAAPQNPVIAQAFGEPDNLVQLKDALGIDLVIKGAAARDKQLGEWELMQSGDGPLPDVEGMEQDQQQKQQQANQVISTVAPGAQAPPVPVTPKLKSSVPTRLMDDHIEEARTCVRIANEQKTLEMLDSQPEIVQDLELHCVEHLTKAQAAGLQIPPDLAAILPKPALPGLSGAAPPPPGAPAPGSPSPPMPGAAGPKPGAAPPVGPLLLPPTNLTGGPSAPATT